MASVPMTKRNLRLFGFHKPNFGRQEIWMFSLSGSHACAPTSAWIATIRSALYAMYNFVSLEKLVFHYSCLGIYGSLAE
jgi:hypothetical protein